MPSRIRETGNKQHFKPACAGCTTKAHRDCLASDRVIWYNQSMKTATLKEDLRSMATTLPETATYSDAMYELYVRMKVSLGKKAAKQGRVMSHAEVKKRFSR